MVCSMSIQERSEGHYTDSFFDGPSYVDTHEAGLSLPTSADFKQRISDMVNMLAAKLPMDNFSSYYTEGLPEIHHLLW